MKDLCLELCTDDFTWDTFISGAQQGSVFARSCVLNEIGDTTHKYFVKKAGRNVAGVPLCLQNGEIIFPVPFCYYQGIIFDDTINQLSPYRRFTWNKNILEFVLRFLIAKYQRFGLTLHHSIFDLRAVKWLSDEGVELLTAPRYTAIIDVSNFESLEDYERHIRKDRRQDIKRAIANQLTVSLSKSLDPFFELLLKTFERTKAPLTDIEKYPFIT